MVRLVVADSSDVLTKAAAACHAADSFGSNMYKHVTAHLAEKWPGWWLAWDLRVKGKALQEKVMGQLVTGTGQLVMGTGQLVREMG
jgi:hypothetical protein